MRATMSLHALARRAASGNIPANRSNNVAFIGLGRMGYEMATNVWKKKFAQNNGGELIVCDVRQEVAMRFVEETSGKGASFVKTPRECVHRCCAQSNSSDRILLISQGRIIGWDNYHNVAVLTPCSLCLRGVLGGSHSYTQGIANRGSTKDSMY